MGSGEDHEYISEKKIGLELYGWQCTCGAECDRVDGYHPTPEQAEAAWKRHTKRTLYQQFKP